MIIIQSTMIPFILVIYKHHKMAYEKHKKSLIGIFLTIEMALAWMFYVQGNGIVNGVCNIEYAHSMHQDAFGGICTGRDPR